MLFWDFTILFAGNTPLKGLRGYTEVFLPITVPGFKTHPQPTSAPSASIPPILRRFVSYSSSPWITTGFPSDFKFEQIEMDSDFLEASNKKIYSQLEKTIESSYLSLNIRKIISYYPLYCNMYKKN